MMIRKTLGLAIVVGLAGCNDGGSSSDDSPNDTSGSASAAFHFTALGPIADGADYPDRLLATPQGVYFVAEGLEDATNEVYRTDGTAEGTEPASDLFDSAFVTWPRELTYWDGDLYLVSDDVRGGSGGEDLVVLDESEVGNLRGVAGDILNDEITPGDAHVEAAGGTLFFVQHDATSKHGRELFKTDGTAAGVELVADINDNGNADGGTESSTPEDLTGSGNHLFFTADDGNGDGRALWVTDGTEAGTEKLLSTPDAAGDLNIGRLYAFEGFEGQVFFRAFGEDRFSGQPWVSDGTAAGTEALDSSIEKSGRFARLDDNTVLLGADNALWQTDGKPSGTSQVSATDAPDSIDSGTAVLNGELYFRTGDREIWATDGTASGTALMMDMGKENSISTAGRPDHFTTLDDRIFFTADPIDESATEEDDARLWVTDGTESGTEAIEPPDATQTDPLTESFHDAFRLVTHDGALYFSAEFTGEGRQLWKLEPVE